MGKWDEDCRKAERYVAEINNIPKQRYARAYKRYLQGFSRLPPKVPAKLPFARALAMRLVLRGLLG